MTGIVAAVALSQVHPPAADGQAQARNVGESSTASTAASVIFQPDWLTTDAVIEGYLDGHKVDGGSGGLFDINAGSGDPLFASNGGTVVNGNSDDGNIVAADGSGSVVASGAAENVPAAGGSGPAGDPSSGPSALFSTPSSEALAEKGGVLSEQRTPDSPVVSMPTEGEARQTAQNTGNSASAPQQPVTESSGPARSDQSSGDGMQALSGTPDTAPGSASGANSVSAPAAAEGDGTAAASAPSESAETTPSPAPTGSGETSQTPAPTEGVGTSPAPTAEPTSPSPGPTTSSPGPTTSTPEPTSPSSVPTTSTPEPTSTTLEPMEPSPEPTTTSPESTTSSQAPTDGTDRYGWNGYDGEGSSDGGNAGWEDGETDPDDRDGNDWNYRYGNN